MSSYMIFVAAPSHGAIFQEVVILNKVKVLFVPQSVISAKAGIQCRCLSSSPFLFFAQHLIMTLTEYYNIVQYLRHTLQGEVACYHAAPVQFEVAALLPRKLFQAKYE